MIKEDWIEVELGEVCFITSGGTPSRNKLEFYQGSIPWVKSGELDKGVIYDTEEYISEDAVKNSSAKIFPEGTLLIALYGATIGKLAFLGVEATTNQAICGIYKSQSIESKYLFNFLLNRKQKLISQGTGGAQPNISQTILKNLSIPLAPLPIQRAIVSKIESLFSDLDNGVANLKTAQAQLKIYRQAVLKKAFEGKLTTEWRRCAINRASTTTASTTTASTTTAEQLLQQIKQERQNHYHQQIEHWKKAVKEWEKNGKIGGKPSKPQNLVSYPKIEQIKSLPILNLGELVFQISIKLMPDDAPNLPFIGMDCLEKNALKPHFIYKFNEFKSAGNWFNANHILYGRMRPYLNKVYHAEYEGVASGEFIVLETTESILPQYLKLILHQQDFVHWSNKQSSGDKPRVKFEQIALYNIKVPTTEEQTQIVAEIERRLSVCDKMEQSISESLQKAEALRQSILKKAFEGKLLSESEIEACKKEADYEPASALLQKIKAEKLAKEQAQKKQIKIKSSNKWQTMQ